MAAGGQSGARSAVSFYPADHPALNITVKSRLEALRREHQENLGSGIAQDWADYKNRCGIIQGLTIGIEFCDRVLEEISH